MINGIGIAFILSIPMPGMRAAIPIMGAFASTGARTGLTPPSRNVLDLPAPALNPFLLFESNQRPVHLQ